MSKATAAIAIVIVLAAAYFLSSGGGNGIGAGPITQSWVNQQLVTWKPQTNSSIGFSVVFTSASYDNILNLNSSEVQNNLLMLLQSGASCIRVDIGYDAFLNNKLVVQLQLTSLIAQIRLAGKCLIIADAAAEQYRQNPLSWSAFKSAWVQRVATLAGLYHPNFYIVIKEPGWYAPMITNPSTSVSDWSNLSNWLAQTVQTVSPQTKSGIAMPGNQLSQSFYNSWFSASIQLPSITFSGTDDYGKADYTQTANYLNNTANYGKSFWIAEAGDSVSYPSYSSSQSLLDVSWMQMLYYFGVTFHCTNLIPFWTNGFSGYGSPPNYSTQTPFFYEFQHLATSYGTAVT